MDDGYDLATKADLKVEVRSLQRTIDQLHEEIEQLSSSIETVNLNTVENFKLIRRAAWFLVALQVLFFLFG